MSHAQKAKAGSSIAQSIDSLLQHVQNVSLASDSLPASEGGLIATSFRERAEALAEAVYFLTNLPFHSAPLDLLDPAAKALEAVNRELELVSVVFTIASGVEPESTFGQTPAERARTLKDLPALLADARDAVRALVLYQHATVSIQQHAESRALLKALKESNDKAESQLASIQASAENQAAEFETVILTSRKALQEAVVSQQAVHFSTQADEHHAAGRWWLLAASAGAAATGWFAWRAYSRVADPVLLPELSPSQVAQYVTGKLLLFSGLISITLWCGRIYRAHRHNYVVNRHRRNALGSFDAIVQSATDDATRNTVLVQATNAIFAPQHSGFSVTEAEPKAPTITEVLKVIPGAKE